MDLPFKAFRPDFELLLKVLRREPTPRPVIFEFILNLEICRKAAQVGEVPEPGSLPYYRMVIDGFRNLGYDYAPVYTWNSDLFSFPKGDQHTLASRSLNQGATITDRKSFETYPWPDARLGNYDLYRRIGALLPEGMKLLGFSNGGILENAIDLAGFDTLCHISLTDPELTGQLFEHIGQRLLQFYTIVASIEAVGACVVNDDWGFRTQTMFPPDMMETFVFPYTRKIVRAIHDQGKPVILHSCGNLKNVMDVIIDDLRVDGKHSFEDAICPVEDAYGWWHDRIAIMGGIDVDFLARRSPSEIYSRSIKLLETTSQTGGFALGSGNSIPAYVPDDNYLAMVKAAIDFCE